MSSEDADFALMWKLQTARSDSERDALVWPSWLAMWRRIARSYVIDAIWHAATGETLGHNGPFPVWPKTFQAECREYLRGTRRS